MIDFIYLLKVIIIAIVEGITEFIPVSSTGHMILVGHFIGFPNDKFGNLFEVVIQLGAILAIVVLYWKKFSTSIISFFKLEKSGLNFWFKIFVACLPAAVLGFIFDDKIDALLFKPLPVAIALIVGAILMIVLENHYRGKATTKSIDKISYRQAFIIGIFQCMALWPGMSRSASTIMGSWIVGLSNVAAAEFSFFLAIPVMVGASGLKIVKSGLALTGSQIIYLIVGFVVAFIVALIVVDKFIDYLKKKPLRGFAVYRLVVGVIIVALCLTHLL